MIAFEVDSNSPEIYLFYWTSREKFVAVNLDNRVTAASDPSATKFFRTEAHAVSWRNSFRVLHKINSAAMPIHESEWKLRRCSL